jgi:RNA polymerase sigma-70 factor, ECF subfamily
MEGREPRPSREIFEALYDAYHGQAFGLAYRMLGHSTDAEDVVQEAFLSAWRSLPTHDPDRGSTRSWLLTMVRNRAIDLLRARRRHSELALDEDLDAPDLDDVPLQAVRHLDTEEAQTALEQLPSEQREVLELAFFGGLTHAQIAERLSLPLGTVKGRLRLALNHVRSTLLDDDESSQLA